MIEFHGGQHYFPCTFGSRNPTSPMTNLRKSVSRDRSKKKWCRESNTDLLVIPYWQEDKLEQVIDSYLKTGLRVLDQPPQKVTDYCKIRREFIKKLVKEEREDVLR
jgi:hypothetical protein